MNINQLDLSSSSEIKCYLEYGEVNLNKQFFETSIDTLQKQRAEDIDALLIKLWDYYQLQSENISLNAVGGYGRATLHPKSDIDIIYTKLSSSQEKNLSVFLTRLWDFGLDIGHAVRSFDDNLVAAKHDITIATCLLDIRKLSGTGLHAENTLIALYQNDIWTSRHFFEDKIAEQEKRHCKAENTALYLEPNIKNNPGGMRDVQTIIWIARKHFDAADAKLLCSLGFLKADEYYELIESYDFICRIRWALHSVAQRPEECLQFKHQFAVAEFMKFGHGDNAQLAVEKMMRQLFRAMTRIQEINQMICGLFSREILCDNVDAKVIPIDDFFSIRNQMIEANYDEVFLNKENVLRLFFWIAEYPQIKTIAPETLRLIRGMRRRLLGELQDYQACRKEFLAIIKHKNGLKTAFSLMHRYGILACYFPQWRAIEGQMQFDMHNAYTVDEHAFKLIQTLDSFNHTKSDSTLVNAIYKKSTLKHVLVIAGLCHDLSGKQSHENNALSAIHAHEFSLLHQLKKSERALICWLINHQDLLMSTLQTHDTQDPGVIKKLVKEIRSESKLNCLYCFTIADLKATNDHSWNEWLESSLNELYFSLRKALQQGAENIFELRTVIRENRSEALSLLVDNGYSKESIKQLWASLPSSFLAINQVEEVVEFSLQLLANKGNMPLVSLSDDANHGCTNLIVYAKDRGMLFVDIFNTLSTLKIKVKEANILKSKGQNVLEIIKILDHNDEAITDPNRLKRVVERIRQVVECETERPTPNSPKFINSFENDPTIEFLNTVKSNKTLVRINALDNPQVIEKICRVFQRQALTIHSAKISKLGECSENVFLISNHKKEEICESGKAQLTDLLLDKMA